jgi:hypothetical protein
MNIFLDGDASGLGLLHRKLGFLWRSLLTKSVIVVNTVELTIKVDVLDANTVVDIVFITVVIGVEVVVTVTVPNNPPSIFERLVSFNNDRKRMDVI